MAHKSEADYSKLYKLKDNKNLSITLKNKYLKELRENITLYRLQKTFNKELAAKITQGKDINITLKTFYKLCLIMNWEFPEYFKVDEKID